MGIWQDGRSIHVASFLAQVTDRELDLTVEISAQRLPCRLIAVRVPPEIAQQRRERVREDARKRAHHLKAETLALCDWTLLLTNLTADQVSLEAALTLLRLRWQIELLFKLWKDVLSIDEWRSEQPWQILCEIYAKLLLVVIQNWLLVLGCWEHADRSWVKAAQVIRKHAFHLAAALPSPSGLRLALTQLIASLERCVMGKRKARPAAFQLLARAHP